MPRLVPVLAAVLALSACDSDGVDIAPGSAITSEAPAEVVPGRDATISARFSNTTGRDLWLGRPEVEPFVQPSADGSAAPVRVVSPIITADVRPTVRIRPGETRDVALASDPALEGYAFADGDYRVGLTLYTTSGERDPAYRGVPAPDAVRFSSAFPLTFR